MKTINVYQLIKSNRAITLESGVLLRNEILKNLELSDSDIINLDFNNVEQFTTMFFNASIGYLVTQFGPEKITKQIQYQNLSLLGQKTWERSFKNAELKKQLGPNVLSERIEEILKSIND